MNENKLLYLLWQILQTLQWAVGIDQQILDQCLNKEMMHQVIFTTVERALNPIRTNLAIHGMIDIKSLEEKRYAARVLTIIVRDFMSPKNLRSELSRYSKDLYTMGVQTLIYFLPSFMHNVLLDPHSE